MNDQEIFAAAIKLAGDARIAFLNAACGEDESLRGQVDSLLAAHEHTGGPLPFKIDRDIDETRAAVRAYSAGIMIGRYKLLEELGEGGMGTVWLAEQKLPVKRRVAIKLIKAGMDSRQVLARFEAERQALAMMDHPNIAKVFDGGVTEQGRPYFVMEFVKGVPLTEYCDQVRLSLKERLQLFMPVCQAVQHAHQKGIIHRDLKPSNILICLYDGKPVPKVIDFGLAKAMHQSLTEQSLYTAQGMMVGTPLYMSPEQAEHNNLDVDTRTDIYSLGVILYELLTGTTPLERQQMKVAAYNEILRLIKEIEPPKPSTRLSGSVGLPSIAAQRSIDPRHLKRLMTGDLDWIVMKALEKERSRRYETANGFLRDIERFLNDEAVEAGPVSSLYRIRKFAKRNKTKLAVSLGVLLMTVASAIVSTYWGLEASKQRNEALTNLRHASEQRDLATEAQADALRQRDAARVSRQRSRAALDEISSKVVHEWLMGLPEFTQSQRDFLQRIATHYEQLSAGRDSGADSDRNLAEGYLKLAEIYSLLGDKRTTNEYLNKSLRHFKELIEGEPQNVELRTQHVAALSLKAVNHSASVSGEESDRIAEDALREAERLVFDFPTDDNCKRLRVATTLDYAIYMAYSNRSLQGLAMLERIAPDVKSLKDEYPDDKASRHQYCVYLTHRYAILGRLERGEEAYDVRLDAIQEADRLAHDFPDDVRIQNSSARNHLNQGIWLSSKEKYAQADSEFFIATDIQSKLCLRFPSSSIYLVSLGQAQLSWSMAKLNSGQSREAGDIAKQAVATWSKLAGRSADLDYIGGLAAARARLAGAELQDGNAERALSILDEALQENQRVVDRDSRNLFAVGDKYLMHTARASALRVLKRFELAAEDMRAAIKAAELIDKRFAVHLVLLAGDLAMSGKPAEVLQLARSTAEEMDDASRRKYLMQLARSACIASKVAEEASKSELENFAADALVQLNQLGTSVDREAFLSPDFDPIRNDPRVIEVLD